MSHDLNGPNNLLFHSNNQRRCQILSLWECSLFWRNQDATGKKINENKPYPLCSLHCILRSMQSQGRRKHITGVYFYHFFYPLPKIYDVAFPKVSSTVVDGSLHSLFSHQVVLATNEVKLVRASVKLLLSRIFKLLWSNYYLSNSMCSISKFF